MMPHITIGMFDSGVGGLTVLREVERLLPDDSFIYFGDTARCPYGGKSSTTIVRYSIENGTFLIDQGIDLLIVACHTASSLALDTLTKTFTIPVLGVVQPAVALATQVTQNGRIGVIGTKATIQSGVYQKELSLRLPEAMVFAQACPLFVPLIEEQFANETISRLIIKEYLEPFKEKNIDTLLLGCTHYPLLEMLIREEIGPNVQIVNPAKTCAEAALKIKTEKLIRAEQATLSQKRAHQFFVSDDPNSFRQIGERFFGIELPLIQTVT